MNDKEKETVEELKKQLRLAVNIDDVTTAIRNDNVQTILNLIEKLQKENEELKKFHIQDNKHLDFIMEHSIPIQKVKDKIEELDKKVKDYQCVENRINLYQRKVLQELLKESEE